MDGGSTQGKEDEEGCENVQSDESVHNLRVAGHPRIRSMCWAAHAGHPEIMWLISPGSMILGKLILLEHSMPPIHLERCSQQSI